MLRRSLFVWGKFVSLRSKDMPVGRYWSIKEELLCRKGVWTTLEWNPGNHFKDAGIRTAKGFVWVMKNNAEAEENKQ